MDRNFNILLPVVFPGSITVMLPSSLCGSAASRLSASLVSLSPDFGHLQLEGVDDQVSFLQLYPQLVKVLTGSQLLRGAWWSSLALCVRRPHIL